MPNRKQSLERHKELGSFVIRVHHRQHDSWQGFVTHLEKNRTLAFRSALDLLKTIDSILDEEEQDAEN